MKNLLFSLALLGGSALATPTAIIHTSMGDITVELDEDRARRLRNSSSTSSITTHSTPAALMPTVMPFSAKW